MTFTRHIGIFTFIFFGNKITGVFSNISICSFWQHIFILANLGESFALCINRSFESLFGLDMTVPIFILQERICSKRVGVKSYPLYKEGVPKRPVLNNFVLF